MDYEISTNDSFIHRMTVYYNEMEGETAYEL